MSGFSAWILSIAGIALLSVVVDLIIPGGQMNKFIKSIFAFFIVLVIVSPLPKLLKKDVDMESILTDDTIVIQQEFVFQFNRDRLDDSQRDILDRLQERGIEGVIVTISANIFTTNMVPESVFVDLFNLVIREKAEHIDIKETIIEAVQDEIKIEREKIVFNE